MDDQAFDALMQESGLSDAVQAAFSGSPQPETPAGTNESQATPEQPVVADAAPLESSEPTSPVDQPVAPQPPVWDTPDNPFYEKAQKADEFINTLHQQALTRKQAEEQAAVEQLIEQLPNLDPDKQQYVLRNLLAYKDQQAQQAVQQLQQQYEPHLGKYVKRDIFSQYEIDEADRKELEQFSDPRQIAFMAKKTHEVKQSANERINALQAELENLKTNQQAITRRNSGVDLPVQAVAGIPSDAQSIDDLVSTLNLSGWS